MSAFDFDLFVIGSGPAGQRAAVQAAKIGKRVAVAERKTVVGGVCINTGTIPSKTLREAVMHLSGYRERGVYGAAYKVKGTITMEDLLQRTGHVIRNEIDVISHQLRRNGIEVVRGDAAFVDPHRIKLSDGDAGGAREMTAENVVIAVGTAATHSGTIPFDGQQIFTSDDILGLKTLPKSIAVIGAGVIGLEYATIFAALDVRVTLVDKRPRLLDFVDGE